MGSKEGIKTCKRTQDMKVVVNKCYGGFSISLKCLERLSELQGKGKIYHFKQDYSKGYSYNETKYIPYTEEERGKRDELFTDSFDVPNPNDYDMKDLWDNHFITNRPEDRSDKLLIQVIEELGEEESSGALSKLRIVEIPDGIDWYIDEYDGIESIHETHQSW